MSIGVGKEGALPPGKDRGVYAASPPKGWQARNVHRSLRAPRWSGVNAAILIAVARSRLGGDLSNCAPTPKQTGKLQPYDRERSVHAVPIALPGLAVTVRLNAHPLKW